MVVPAEAFANVITANSATVESLNLIPKRWRDPLPSSTGLVGVLAAAALPQLQALRLNYVKDDMAFGLHHDAYMPHLRHLELYRMSSAGLAAVLVGANGGQLRTFNLSITGLVGAFSDVLLPNLTDVSIDT
jgi:hypothetical protein